MDGHGGFFARGHWTVFEVMKDIHIERQTQMYIRNLTT